MDLASFQRDAGDRRSRIHEPYQLTRTRDDGLQPWCHLIGSTSSRRHALGPQRSHCCTTAGAPGAGQGTREALFLHSDSAGSTYLYVEQQNGSRLSVYDVSDPGHIRLASTVMVEAQGAFDLVQEVGSDADLVRFRDDGRTAVLDLRKAKRPTLHNVPAWNGTTQAEALGSTALLTTPTPASSFASASHRDIRVLDTSTATDPRTIAMIPDVEHRITRRETGTTFLLGGTGLTVIRRTDIEAEHQIHEMQMRGN